MNDWKPRIERNLHRVRLNIEAACERRGRSPREVSLVAVTKSVEMDAIKALLDLGVRDLGESRAQQLLARSRELHETLQARPASNRPEVRWHMVGHLQRNKVRQVVGRAGTIHSIDSLRLAEEIEELAARDGVAVDVLVQVNCSQEPQKFGVAAGAAGHLGEVIASLKHVRLVGLMTMAALEADEGEIRNTFIRLREIFEDMRTERIGGEAFHHLSMGMSNDYPVAVEEGATLVRIGSALFE